MTIRPALICGYNDRSFIVIWILSPLSREIASSRLSLGPMTYLGQIWVLTCAAWLNLTLKAVGLPHNGPATLQHRECLVRSVTVASPTGHRGSKADERTRATFIFPFRSVTSLRMTAYLRFFPRIPLCKCISHFHYTYIGWWTLRLFPLPGYYKKKNNIKYGRASISVEESLGYISKKDIAGQGIYLRMTLL